MENVKKTKINKENIVKKVMACTLAFLMVLSVGATLIGVLVSK